MGATHKWTALLLALTLLLLPACSSGRKLLPEIETQTADQEETRTKKTVKTEKEYSFKVDSPYKEIPRYIFDREPTAAEMRAAAVDLMRKALTVQWYTPQDFEVSTSVSKTEFSANTRYAGIPYTGINTSLYAFLDFLDPENGRLLFEDLSVQGSASLSQVFQSRIGSSCSGTVGWAISAVCNSVGGTFQSYYMVARNGWLPLGDYTYDLSTPSFGREDSKDDTDSILARYGEQKMFQCYALLQPGDILVWQNTVKLGHTMMATDAAVVVKNPDGTIDGDQSYVLIQDQRSGGHPQADEGTGHIYAGQGRVDCKYTFKELFQKNNEGYIPMTTAEFQGQKPYEFPSVSADPEEITGPGDMEQTTVRCNYPMATIALYAENKETGKRERLSYHGFSRDEIARGTAKAYELRSFSAILARSTKVRNGDFRITVEAKTPNGQLFTPISFDYTAK
ncbi:MAG: hypothetical protein J6Z79_05355 [Clostridia bacterium]|nr:hypothetical protein [Clostridia bacterium]